MRHYPAEYNEDDPLYLDFETVGFSGFPILLQYAIGDGPVVLHNIAFSTVQKTLEIIEDIFTHKGGIVGFNLVFDYFHAVKCYNVLRHIEDKTEWVEDVMPEIELLEARCFEDMVCLKPPKTLDLMLFCRSTTLQICMNRKNLILRRIPCELGEELARELNGRVELPGILFSRRADPSVRFVTQEIKNDDDTIDTDFVDIVLRFGPSTALKAICKYVKIAKKKRLIFSDVEIEDKYRPDEYEFCPFAYLIPKEKRWTTMYLYHAEHWMKSEPMEYAEDDIHDTRNLHKYFMNNPSSYGVPQWDTVDNALVSLVPNTRYRGFKIDKDQVVILKKRAVEVVKKAKHNFGSHQVCKKYMTESLEPEIEMILADPKTGKLSTNGDNLKAIAKLFMPADTCEDCFAEGCDKCIDGLIPVFEYIKDPEGRTHKVPKKHPYAVRAQEILDYRHMKKEIELYDKLLLTGRLFPDVKIIGAKSSRMAGAGGFNFQGVKKAKYVRQAFPLKDDYEFLGIGDLDAFEVSIMEAVYADPILREDLLSGKKIHALFALALFPDKTYEEIMETKDYPDEINLYAKGKACLFAMLYGATEAKIADTACIDIEQARQAFNNFGKRYPMWRKKFDQTIKDHSALVQGASGGKIVWKDPKMFAETLFGFKRYFNIDYDVARTLFDLAQDIPKSWFKIKGTVRRRDRDQTVVGALRSALYAAAYGLISAVIRQAQNHEIQGSGAYVTKKIQEKVWDIQPVGVHPLIVRLIQIHDEVIVCGDREYIDKVKEIVLETVETFRPQIPLIGMGWDKDAESWADK